MLVEIFRHQQKLELANICETAGAFLDEVQYSGWSDGFYEWQLRLELPAPEFSSIESRLGEIEKEISSKVSHFDRQYQNHTIASVIITPVASATSTERRQLLPSDTEIEHIWKKREFRLFLSHLAKDKAAVAELKSKLSSYGIDCFVAHEDIEPTKEWQHEIELALRSMQALVALLTPNFHESNWTDQEIGWAMGRGVPVISVRLGCDPYGFIGRYQGIPTHSLDSPDSLAREIVKLLLQNSLTYPSIRKALLFRFYNSDLYITTQKVFKLITDFSDLSPEEIKQIQQACIDNYNVKGAYGIPEKIEKRFGNLEPLVNVSVEDDEVPF